MALELLSRSDTEELNRPEESHVGPMPRPLALLVVVMCWPCRGLRRHSLLRLRRQRRPHRRSRSRDALRRCRDAWLTWSALGVRFFLWVVLLPAALSCGLSRNRSKGASDHPLRWLPAHVAGQHCRVLLSDAGTPRALLAAGDSGGRRSLLGAVAARWSTQEPATGTTRIGRAHPFLVAMLVGCAGMASVGQLSGSDVDLQAPPPADGERPRAAISAIGLTALVCAAALDPAGRWGRGASASTSSPCKSVARRQQPVPVCDRACSPTPAYCLVGRRIPVDGRQGA